MSITNCQEAIQVYSSTFIEPETSTLSTLNLHVPEEIWVSNSHSGSQHSSQKVTSVGSPPLAGISKNRPRTKLSKSTNALWDVYEIRWPSTTLTHWCTEKWTLLRLCSWQCSWKHGRNRHLRDLSTLTLTVRSVTFHGKTASRQMPQLPRKTQGLRLRPKKSTPPASVRCRIFLPWGINCKNTSWMFTLDEILYHIIYVYILTY